LDKRYLKDFDYTLLLGVMAIMAMGCLAIFSASGGGSRGLHYLEKQAMWMVLGAVCAVLCASVPTGLLQRQASRLYNLTILVLAGVLVMGHSSKGAQRWIQVGGFQLQPSEFAKIALIIALAVFLVKRQDEIRSFKLFVLSFLYLAVPMGLIFKQPDLGTSLVLTAIWITMAFVMGTDRRNIAILVGGVLIGALVLWHLPGVLKDYQKNRVISFVNPAADPLGSGYHVTQSRIAIGSGRLTGKGIMQGTQRKLKFIPEQHTDFIFTVVGEEMGFAGAVVLLLLYFVVVWRALNIMSSTEDSVGRAITAGVAGMLLFHVFVNIGMTVGIMPVTGVPLPLFSYGGSSLMANMMAIGLIEGISMRRHRISF
jgi:rod shape determining protein RodA